MLKKEIIEKLKERYSTVHPLLFHRSVEHAKSNGDLFDILDTIPEKYPLIWCENVHEEGKGRWVHNKDLYLTEEFFEENNNEIV